MVVARQKVWPVSKVTSSRAQVAVSVKSSIRRNRESGDKRGRMREVSGFEKK